ncbi:putative transcription factor TGA like domain-containing protein [Helianthus annuus]|uniref:Transcription factor TGA like domain-containing protein n=1 Tax=Helianthus annuus TaxID=4232 RepID=A0A251T440_HELAN|nr:putative transcription factor TGA like domain-containing protein [Helianthus annuus]KAJ0864061.1 putative transcription factor TGA like domain-containing protein [Helianthus annuus]
MTTSTSNHGSSFHHWIFLQQADLEELMNVLTTVSEADIELLHRVSQKTIQHLSDYQQTRSVHHGIDSKKLEFELSKLLIIGDRIGSKREMECSDMQVKLIEALHVETVKSEDKISSRMANLQECVAIEPLVIGYSDGVEQALEAHRVAFNEVVMDADELRVKVLKELVDHILTPLQGVHLLVASTRLHLSIHEWGKR